MSRTPETQNGIISTRKKLEMLQNVFHATGRRVQLQETISESNTDFNQFNRQNIVPNIDTIYNALGNKSTVDKLVGDMLERHPEKDLNLALRRAKGIQETWFVGFTDADGEKNVGIVAGTFRAPHGKEKHLLVYAITNEGNFRLESLQIGTDQIIGWEMQTLDKLSLP